MTDGELMQSQRGCKLLMLGILVTNLVACQNSSKQWLKEGDAIRQTMQQNQAVANQTQTQVAETADADSAGNAKIYQGQPLSAKRVTQSRSNDAPKPVASGGDIFLSFADTPIADVVQMILGDQLGKKYTIQPNVTGSVSLSNQMGMNKSDLIPTLSALLDSVDAQLIETEGEYQVVAGAKKKRVFTGANLEIIPLRYISAEQFDKLIRNYQVSTSVIQQGNLIAVSGSKTKLAQVRKVAKSFDVNWLQGMSVAIFPVENASAASVKRELTALFGSQIDSKVASAIRVVPIERTNSLLVIAAQTDYLKMVGDWVKRLDQLGGNNQFYIYRVQNGKASDLAKLIEAMFGSPKQSQSELTEPQQPTIKISNTPNDLRVVADESSNSLIITGSPHYFKQVRQAMLELDSAPLQVLVEAKIMELTLSDDLKYGIEWYLQGSRANTQTTGSLDFGTRGLGVTAPGFSYVLERAGQVRAALNALAGDSRLKVLSSPSLMVLNNQTASILVGDEVPVPTRQVISNISPEAPTINEIEYRNTGILLTVTPRVNSGGMVTMDINQEVSSVTRNTVSQIDAPTIQQRQLNSTVSIQSGQTVVLGGLIREQQSLSDSGVPVLKNLPGVGKLFSTTNDNVLRTELVALITPRVINNRQDTESITREYSEKMLGLQPILLSEL